MVRFIVFFSDKLQKKKLLVLVVPAAISMENIVIKSREFFTDLAVYYDLNFTLECW